jgi:hypothetical protein
VVRTWHKTLIWLMWLALPTTALPYWRAWDQLPLRMAVHFDANWQPNGYTSREGALILGLGIMGFVLVVCTIAALVSSVLKPAAAWPTLVVAYMTLGFSVYGNFCIIDFNLKAPPAHSRLAGPHPPAISDSSEFFNLHL